MTPTRDLRPPQLTGALPVEELAKVKTLKRIHLHSNALTTAEASTAQVELEARLPSCEVTNSARQRRRRRQRTAAKFDDRETKNPPPTARPPHRRPAPSPTVHTRARASRPVCRAKAMTARGGLNE
jgi:hypothetical protein